MLLIRIAIRVNSGCDLGEQLASLCFGQGSQIDCRSGGGWRGLDKRRGCRGSGMRRSRWRNGGIDRQQALPLGHAAAQESTAGSFGAVLGIPSIFAHEINKFDDRLQVGQNEGGDWAQTQALERRASSCFAFGKLVLGVGFLSCRFFVSFGLDAGLGLEDDVRIECLSATRHPHVCWGYGPRCHERRNLGLRGRWTGDVRMKWNRCMHRVRESRGDQGLAVLVVLDLQSG